MYCGTLILLVVPIITKPYPILLQPINTKFLVRLLYVIGQEWLVMYLLYKEPVTQYLFKNKTLKELSNI